MALAYADCGTYGALDEAVRRAGPGAGWAACTATTCSAAPDRIAALLAAEPGTYLLTDFLVRSFDRTVLAGLGLDRHPELWPDYFGHYRRLVWLAQARDADLDAAAAASPGGSACRSRSSTPARPAWSASLSGWSAAARAEEP